MSIAPSAHETGPAPQSALRFLPLGLLAVAVLALWASGITAELRFDRLMARRDDLAALVETYPLASAGLFLLIYCAVAALGVPGAAVLTLIGGGLFGAPEGALLAIAGATTGGTLLFLVARSSLGDWMRSRIGGGKLERFAEGFRQDAASYLLFLRLVAVFPFWLVNLAAALIGAPARIFIWTTAIGIAPASFLFALAGAGVDGALVAWRADKAACLAAGGTECALPLSPLSLLQPEMIFALVGLGLLALAPVAARRLRGGRSGKAE